MILIFQKQLYDDANDVFVDGEKVDTVPPSIKTPRLYANYGVKPDMKIFCELERLGIFPRYKYLAQECQIIIRDLVGFFKLPGVIRFNSNKPVPTSVTLRARFTKNKDRLYASHWLPAFEKTIENGRVAVLKTPHDEQNEQKMYIEVPHDFLVQNFSPSGELTVVNFVKKLVLS